MEIVVFGSAAQNRLTGVKPRDIDVAYRGDWTHFHDTCVAVWAAERGLSGLPVDRHSIVHKSIGRPVAVHLPAPCGVRGDCSVLSGPVDIRWVDYWSIPAILRVFGASPGRAADEIAKLRYSLSTSTIDIGDRGTERDAWTNYTVGLTALRSALLHAPRWREIFALVPEGPLLQALAERGARQDAIDLASKRSSGNRARLFFKDDGIVYQYAHETIPWSDAVNQIAMPEAA